MLFVFILVFHYQIALHISAKSRPANGRISITLLTKLGDSGEVKNFTINRLLTRTEPGKIHTLLVTFPFNFKVGNVTNVLVLWKKFASDEKQQIGFKMIVDYVEVNYLSHILQK